jgi:hypothetical protein
MFYCVYHSGELELTETDNCRVAGKGQVMNIYTGLGQNCQAILILTNGLPGVTF